MASAAVWLIAKAALLNNAAVRLFNSELVRKPHRVPPPLSDWLAERLLTPGEFEQYGAQRDAVGSDSPV